MNDSRYHCKTCGDWNTYSDPPSADSRPIIFRCTNCGAKGELAAGTKVIEWGPSKWTPKDAIQFGPFTLGRDSWSTIGLPGDDE